VFGGLKKIDKRALAFAASAARANGYEPLVGTYASDAGLLPPSGLTNIGSFSYRQIEQTFNEPPRFTVTKTDTIELGVINTDGSITVLDR
jgi:hypothetical protein